MHKIFHLLELSHTVSSHGFFLSIGLDQHGRSQGLIRSNLFTMLIDAVGRLKRAAREVSDQALRSQIRRVASAIEWTLKETKRLARRDASFSPLYAFTLVFLISGVGYLYLADRLGVQPPHDKQYLEITAQSDLCRDLRRVGIDMALPGTLEETLDFLLDEVRTNLKKTVVARDVGIRMRPPEKSPPRS